MDNITQINQTTQTRASRVVRKNISSPHIRQADSQLLELGSLLQSTLEIEKLIEFFHDELKTAIDHDGLVFEIPDESIKYEFGRSGKHKAHYNLILLDKFLGQLQISRNRKFTQEDLDRVELLSTALLYPVRNSLMYLQALKTAYRDPLTGLNNRAALDNDLEQELDFAQRHDLALSIIILDLDKFKHINDTYGHITGDEVLKKLADCMTQCIRRSDIIYRYGGEEFVVLLRSTATGGARLLAGRIRKAVERLVCRHDDIEFSVTASLGVATLKEKETISSFLERADEALYAAKEGGRNQTVVAE